VILVWRDYEQMSRYRRPLAVILAVTGLLCSTLALVDAFDLAHVPGAGILGAASCLFLAATWLVIAQRPRADHAHES